MPYLNTVTGEIAGLKKPDTAYFGWAALHSPNHPVPFLGAGRPGGTNANFFAADQSSQHAMADMETRHPGCPPEGIIKRHPPLYFDIMNQDAYTGTAVLHRTKSVQSVCRNIYLQAPRAGFPGPQSAESSTQMRICAAIVCREIVDASEMIASAIPVQIGQAYLPHGQPRGQHGAVHFAASIELTSGAWILLPLAISVTGSHPFLEKEKVAQAGYTQGWVRYTDPAAARISDSAKVDEARRKEVFDGIMRKFRQSPVLIIQDVRMLAKSHKKAHGELEYWQPRRYTDVWYLQEALGVDGAQAKLRWSTNHDMPFSLFRTMGPLAERVIQLCATVIWKRTPPDTPLEFVDDISSFAFHFKAPNIRDGTMRNTLHGHWSAFADGEETCLLFEDCYQPQTVNSRYCWYHKRSVENVMSHEIRILEPNELSHRTMNSLLVLKDLYQGANGITTWIIDFEGWVLTAKAGLLMQLSIRDIGGKALLSCTFKYEEKSLSDVAEQISQYLSEGSMKGFKKKFVDVYGGHFTHGLKVREVRLEIMRLGYNPRTHALLSYGGSDMQYFTRILLGKDSLVVDRHGFDKTEAGLGMAFQPVDVLGIARGMVTRCPSAKLKVIHRTFCPDTTLTNYHDADIDTLAMAELIQAFVVFAMDLHV